jgi:hypothetical protein
MAVPTTGDLTTFLTSIGVTAPAAVDEAVILATATAEFEARTGRRKFEGDSAATAVRYTLQWPQGANVQLQISDVWAAPTVTTGYSGTGTGTALTEYTHYELLPLNWSTIGRPVEAIRFNDTPSIDSGAILVNAKLGYAQTMPSDVFQAILSKAAALVLTQMAGESGSVSDQKQGDRQVRYGQEAGRATIDRLTNAFEQTVSRYIKVGY